MLATPALRQRVLCYWLKLYSGQSKEGEEYELLRPTISVCFVDGVLFPAVPQHHLAFRLIDTTEGVALTDDLTIHFFELPKFRVTAQELATPLETWLYFLREGESLDSEALPRSLDTVEIRQAMEALTMLAQVDIQKEIYEGRMKARRDQATLLKAVARAQAQADEAQAALARARAEAVEAHRQGLAEGRAEGLGTGALIGRVEVLQRLLRREGTARGALEAMPLEALEALAAQLEREATG